MDNNSKPATPIRLRRQLSLRTFLVLFTVGVVVFGYFADRARRQKQAVLALGEHGYVIYAHEMVSTGRHTVENVYGAEAPAPRIIRRLVGDDFFRSVRYAQVNGSKTVVEQLRNLPDIERLVLGGKELSDGDLASVAELTKLEELTITNAHQITDDGLNHFADSKLKKLQLENAHKLTDDGFRHIASMTDLRRIKLKDVSVTAAALRHLAKIERLTSLSVEHVPLTDDSVDLLAKLSVRVLYLEGTAITQNGVKRLQELNPNVHIRYYEGVSVGPGSNWGFPQNDVVRKQQEERRKRHPRRPPVGASR